MRIVLAVDGTRGDVFPMVALAGHLRGAGHDVLICGPPDSEVECTEGGFAFRPMGLDVRAFAQREAHALSNGALGWAAAGKRYLTETLKQQFAHLPAASEGADLILGAGVCFAGGSAAELHGIPYRFVTYCPVLLPSQEHPPFLFPTATTPPWLNRLLWRFTIPPVAKLIAIPINRERRQLGLRPLSNGYRALLSDHPILACDPELAPAPADCPVDVQQIGCLHPTTGPPLPEKLEAFLESGPPPVYVGFGSMTDGNAAQTTKGVIRAAQTLGQRVLLSGGWAGLGNGPLPSTVFRVGTVDHNQLFPRASVIVHHGGAGTTTAAARAGVPQIVVPHGADQYWWGTRIHRMGLGPPPISRPRFDEHSLEAALRAVADAEIVTLRAREVGARIRQRAEDLPHPTAVLQGRAT